MTGFLKAGNEDVQWPNIRAAICEFDGGLTRADAEQLAAQCQGYDNVVGFPAAEQSNLSGKDDG